MPRNHLKCKFSSILLCIIIVAICYNLTCSVMTWKVSYQEKDRLQIFYNYLNLEMFPPLSRGVPSFTGVCLPAPAGDLLPTLEPPREPYTLTMS